MNDVQLTSRQAQVLQSLQADRARSLRSIAKELGISHQRVWQIVAYLSNRGVISGDRMPKQRVKTVQRRDAIERARWAHNDAMDNYFKKLNART